VSRYVFKLPDLAEGTVEAEILSWRVRPGDMVNEDDPLVEVTTEKAAVELRSPVGGKVIAVSGAPGDRVAVGAQLAVFETSAATGSAAILETEPKPAQRGGTTLAQASPGHLSDMAAELQPVSTSPAIRRQAREQGIDLAGVKGSGPGGRITREDLEEHIQARVAEGHVSAGTEHTTNPIDSDNRSPRPPADSNTDVVEEVKISGVRRVIAERMATTLSIPHFTYVEEVDVTELESLRTQLNSRRHGAAALSYLPFIIRALVRALRQYPQCNATHDVERGVLLRYRAVHVGIATQTESGLKVPVLRDAGTKSLEELATEIHRLSVAARSNTATRRDLSGSTITVTSLGKLGGLVSTPIINTPELAIIGVNRATERPAVHMGAVVIRRIMNLSSSFDHRFIDGYDAASFVRSLKSLLEHPATIFIDEPP
jgi:2-oxoisovalerate dehydrogenase E2 component (dihydrolipoyl transacylase)